MHGSSWREVVVIIESDHMSIQRKLHSYSQFMIAHATSYLSYKIKNLLALDVYVKTIHFFHTLRTISYIYKTKIVQTLYNIRTIMVIFSV